MSKLAPLIGDSDSPDALRRFVDRVKTNLGWVTGQQKNAPKLPVLDANTATTAQIVAAYNLVRQRLDGQD